MLRFSYETSTNSWFYGEWIVKIIAKSNDFNNPFCFAQEKERNYER